MFRLTMHYPPPLFRDRTEAGEKLGQGLLAVELQDPVVLAIPAGGVPVGAEIARILGAPLNLIIARKIQFPWTTEAGFGAVVSDGTVYLGPHSKTLPREAVEAQTQKALGEVEHRKQEFLEDRQEIDISDKDAILVDDGLATGSTMIAAVTALKKRAPRRVIVAVPTASGTAVNLLRPRVDQLISLYVHPEHMPFAVASSYHQWHDLTDQEVKEYLGEL